MPLINLGTLPGDGTGDNRRVAGQKLNAFTPLILKSIVLTAPPSSPSTNDRYIVGASAASEWAGQDGKIACYQESFWDGTTWDENGGWMFFDPITGMIATLETDDSVLRFDGSDWLEILPAGGIPTESLLTSADRTKLDSVEENAEENLSDAEIVTAYQTIVTPVSGTEKTDGTETGERCFSPADVAEMIATHGAASESPLLATIVFNGTGTPAESSSFNVDAITDLGSGKFEINLTNPVDINSVVLATAQRTKVTPNLYATCLAFLKDTTTVSLRVGYADTYSGQLWVDPEVAHVAVFATPT